MAATATTRCSRLVGDRVSWDLVVLNGGGDDPTPELKRAWVTTTTTTRPKPHPPPASGHDTFHRIYERRWQRESHAGIHAAIIILEAHFGDATWAQLFTEYTHRAVVGITCQLFAQFKGINAILYFLPVNLTRAGFNVSPSLLYAGACALV